MQTVFQVRGVSPALVVGVVVALSGCPRPRGVRRPPRRPGPVLPRPPQWPAVSPTSAERYRDALELALALPDSPRVRRIRRSLQVHIVSRLGAELRHGQGVKGFAHFLDMLSLFSDLGSRSPGKLPAPVAADLERAARMVLTTFAPRGGAEESLTALAVLVSLKRGQHTRRKELLQVVRWLVDLQEPLLGRIPRRSDAVEVLSKVHRRWPSPFVRRTLARLLARQHRALEAFGRMGKVPPLRPVRQAVAAAREYGWQRVRLQVIDRDRRGLLRTLSQVRAGAYGDAHLAKLLAAALDARQGIAPLLTLSEALAPRWPLSARELCRMALSRRPQDPNGHYCLGTLALRQKHTLAALIHFEAAIRAEPTYRRAWDVYAATYLDRLMALLAQERLDQVRLEVRFLERLHGVARAWFVAHPLKSSMAEVSFMLGRGLFDAGLIGEAVRVLRRALKIRPTPQVQLQLAEIAFWRGRQEVAIARLDALQKGIRGSFGWRTYWKFRTTPLRIRAHKRLAAALRARASRTRDRRVAHGLRRKAKTSEASAELLRRQALRSGQFLLRALRNPRLQAEVLVTVGTLFYEAGQRRIALRSFETALDRAPERSSTYVDVISFLVMRGHFDEALDAYHRALARTEVSEYLKAYCSFWILDLGKRMKVDPERLGLVEVFLKHLKGKQWYHQLARFHLGLASYSELAAKARTKGQRAELDFYRSMRLLRQGKGALARRLWQRIVDSEMMAFFEYKMVRRYLRLGAPIRPPGR